MKKMILGGAGVLVVSVAGLVIYQSILNFGHLQLEVEPGGAIAEIDKTARLVEAGGTVLKLRPGEYEITIRKPNYKTVDQTFVIRRGQTQPLRLQLQTATVEEIISEAVGSSQLPGGLPFRVEQPRFFESGQWLVAELVPPPEATINGAVVILQLQADGWKLVDGPTTQFGFSLRQKVPASVYQELENLGYVAE